MSLRVSIIKDGITKVLMDTSVPVKMEMDEVPDVESMEETAVVLGCIICSDIRVITEVRPHSIRGLKAFPYSSNTRFVAVYCTPCVNSSLGFAKDSRVTESMIMSTKVYKDANKHVNMKKDLIVRPFHSLYVVMKAKAFTNGIQETDVISCIDPDVRMQLRRCVAGDFFSEVNMRTLPFTDAESTDTEIEINRK